MTNGRMRRVDEAIRQVIGEVVAGELKDPRVGFVTVTDVRTSADLSHARVYVSVLGSEPQRAATLEGLSSAHGYLQQRVASRLRLKRTPTLSFLYDETTDRAMRMEELLQPVAPSLERDGDLPTGERGDDTPSREDTEDAPSGKNGEDAPSRERGDD
jgi:ribosome-binding factor A